MRKKKIIISLYILCMVCETSCGQIKKEQKNQKQENEIVKQKEKIKEETEEEAEKEIETTENIEKKTELPEGSLEEDEIAIRRSLQYNPITGQDEKGAWQYGGDPAVLVDKDTVYLYTGRDASSDEEVKKAIYVMREWVCYSTKDLEHWQYEGSIMKADTKSIPWATGSTSAWASQVAKHYDAKAKKDQYYLYYCTWDKTSAGKMSIGVAVSDSPTGPFLDKGEPLVKGTLTEPQTSISHFK